MTRPRDDNHMDRELTRLLAGELPPEEERELRARIEREPELAAACRRLERSWQALALPPPAPAPPWFAAGVMARVRQEARQQMGGGLSWSAAPGWVRGAAAAALALGLALGAGLGSVTGTGTMLGSSVSQSNEISAEESQESSLTPDSLAESYWSLVENVGDVGTDDTTGADLEDSGEILP